MLAALLIAVFATLPEGSAPPALEVLHFPSRLHTYVWRNWSLVPIDRMAAAIDAKPEELLGIAHSMGLKEAPTISEDQIRRSYITVIRRNWHLLPYPQLLKLLDWTEEKLAYTLREDDFLWVKLGLLKPKCAPLAYVPPTPEQDARAKEIAQIASPALELLSNYDGDPLFGFVKDLSKPIDTPPLVAKGGLHPRYCHSYFALYGDTLLNPGPDPYPDGYLDRLAATGVDGVWLQGVLYKLAPYPWDTGISEGHETRIENLRKLVARAKARGIGVWVYLNEPRAMPQAFFEKHPEVKGVSEGDYAVMCTSTPEVRAYLTKSIAKICTEVPDLAGFFTISASENLTHCWSHYQGTQCSRCAPRGAASVVAELHASFQAGIDQAKSSAKLIAWDWGWQDAWANEAIVALPKAVDLMSVSEWSIPIERGGIAATVGEYSLSTIGPGPRATAHWATARETGHCALAKLQLGTTWELGAMPYVPAVANVAEHMTRLRKAGVEGVMLGWTLGGYPSPNLEVATAMLQDSTLSGEDAMRAVATRRFGADHADKVVAAWKTISTAFQEFPYDGAPIYQAPFQQGPSNLLWPEPTGYASTMVGIPYDAVPAWCGVYPPEIFAGQLDKVAEGFEAGAAMFRGPTEAYGREERLIRACAIHYRAAATQTRFVVARDALLATNDGTTAVPLIETLKECLAKQRKLAEELTLSQWNDSRIGYEATNHYFYVPMDLIESSINCDYLEKHWLPAQIARIPVATTTKRYDADGVFSFEAPEDLQRLYLQGIDSHVAGWRRLGLNICMDHGWYSSTLEEWEGAERRWTKIDGKRACIVMHGKQAGAYFPELEESANGTTKLSFVIQMDNPDPKLAEAILTSIDFP